VILVDSSAWIDYFRGADSRVAEALDSILGVELVVVGDLILAEVMQGFVLDRDLASARRLFDSPVVETLTLGGRDIALKTAANHRLLRSRGVTVRKRIDGIIATRCIESRLTLLHADRDFQPYVEHLGLRSFL
jgi:predicted nucleic acid-binding protein